MFIESNNYVPASLFEDAEHVPTAMTSGDDQYRGIFIIDSGEPANALCIRLAELPTTPTVCIISDDPDIFETPDNSLFGEMLDLHTIYADYSLLLIRNHTNEDTNIPYVNHYHQYALNQKYKNFISGYFQIRKYTVKHMRNMMALYNQIISVIYNIISDPMLLLYMEFQEEEEL